MEPVEPEVPETIHRMCEPKAGRMTVAVGTPAKGSGSQPASELGHDVRGAAPMVGRRNRA